MTTEEYCKIKIINKTCFLSKKRAGPTANKVIDIKFIVGIFLISFSHYIFACFFEKVKHRTLSRNKGMCVRMVLFPALEFNIFMFV